MDGLAPDGIGREPGDFLLRTTYRRVVAALRRADPTLSGHSLRRGALQDLLLSGVGLEAIRQVSRHSSINSLVRYLDSAKLELARQSAATTRKLRM